MLVGLQETKKQQLIVALCREWMGSGVVGKARVLIIVTTYRSADVVLSALTHIVLKIMPALCAKAYCKTIKGQNFSFTQQCMSYKHFFFSEFCSHLNFMSVSSIVGI